MSEVETEEEIKKGALSDLEHLEAKIEQLYDCHNKELMRGELRLLRVILMGRLYEAEERNFEAMGNGTIRYR